MTISFDWLIFEALPAIGILRGYGMQEVENIVRHSAKGGLRNIEITMNSENAAALIRLAKERAEGKMNVGAGTVCSLGDLDEALSAGATFIVTPIVNADVIGSCNKAHIPVIPGAFTPTEIYQAWQLGADMVKLFPANRFGPEYLKDIRGPLDRIKLVPNRHATNAKSTSGADRLPHNVFGPHSVFGSAVSGLVDPPTHSAMALAVRSKCR